MNHLIFPPELRTASVVPRWSIVWTLNKDTVTNHTFYVVFYAYHIAQMIRWDGPVAALMYKALVHDLDETITGDIVSPVKREIVDDERMGDYIRKKMSERLRVVTDELNNYEVGLNDKTLDEMDAIIKVADRLDALLFLIIEKRVGNTVIGPRIPSAMSNLEAAWRDLPELPDELDRLWATHVLPSIHAHETSGGFGV